MARQDVEDKLRSSYVLFSCEGTAEVVIMEKLVEADVLLVSRRHIVEDPLYFKPYTRLRKASDIGTQRIQSFL